jgi:pyruvate kinase
VANAVLDGIDAVLLGAETLRGSYPLECVRTVLAIAQQAELVFDHAHHFEYLLQAAMQARRAVAEPVRSRALRKAGADACLSCAHERGTSVALCGDALT